MICDIYMYLHFIQTPNHDSEGHFRCIQLLDLLQMQFFSTNCACSEGTYCVIITTPRKYWYWQVRRARMIQEDIITIQRKHRWHWVPERLSWATFVMIRLWFSQGYGYTCKSDDMPCTRVLTLTHSSKMKHYRCKLSSLCLSSAVQWFI